MKDKSSKAPAFQFYANDWLSSPKIMLMKPEHEGAYIRLLCYDWSNDGIPDDDLKLSVLSRLGESWNATAKDIIRDCFIKHPTRECFLTNERLLSERKKQKKYNSKQAENAKQRWHKDLTIMPPHQSGICQTDAKSMPPQCSSSSSSSSSSDKENIIKEIDEQNHFTVEQMEKKIVGIPRYAKDELKAFVDYWNQYGWKDGRKEIVDFKSSFLNWQRNGARLGIEYKDKTAPKTPDEIVSECRANNAKAMAELMAPIPNQDEII